MTPSDNTLDELVTEAWDADGADLDLRSTAELVELMNVEDATVPAAVAGATYAIAGAIDAIVARLQSGGRLIYVGAGTSGRLAVVDAAECESTFSTMPGQVVALIAGGTSSSPVEQEAAEDDVESGRQALEQVDASAADAIVGVSASGRTPYVVGAMEHARSQGALTVAVVNVQGSELGAVVEHEIAVVVGAEILAGSTRLKAGTAQKLILNMLSTIAMIRIGKTYGNLMVDVYATNEKLHARVRRIVRHATAASPEAIEDALAASGGDAKVAIVSLLAQIDSATARERLAAAGGVVREALGR